jgi:2-polyprenyl-3-methyl-5-hydroxy-6-metoxy-1,4-benzoquinol methylase
MSDILWRRLRYTLSPQWDLYHSLVPHLKDKKVLEVGFGTGFGTLQYAPTSSSVTALETDKDACEFACRCIPLPDVAWVKGDLLDLEARPEFDAVVMVEVLEHLGPWSLALSQAQRLLKPGGNLYISARNANADLRRNELHFRELSAGEFVEMLRLFFDPVKLYDYTLTQELDCTTRVTPLIAIATK